ncbi:6-bladed beta-propeller [Parabacteroides sp. PF5-9]|uniref:6-bladed beta-propeller n=1 Tax=Parabacteroides sp. PF5-9 TaxID=1742404 RepID=UPI0024761415|nr:6-bladed beta-propeller [Parabacteroides sp. PF5-9]MDH6359004.1 hypothetical protein [Parabacteroides sp. PF5-9]
MNNNVAQIIVVLLVLLSCKQEADFVTLSVSSAKNGCNLSSIVENVVVVPLETNENCLLDQTLKVKVDDDLMFVLNQQEIFLFNMNGSFIKQLTRRGDGPEDVIVNGFTLDTNKKELVVWTPQQTVLFFTYDGRFVRKEVLDKSKQCLSISYFDFFFWVKAQTFQNVDDVVMINKWVLKYDKDFGLIDSLLLTSYEGAKGFVSYDYSDEISIVDNCQYVHTPTTKRDKILRDTLYLLQDKAMKPVIMIDYGNLNYTEIGHPMMVGYPITLSPIQVSQRFIFSPYFEYTEERRGYGLYLYDKNEQQGYWAKQGIMDDLFGTGWISHIESMDLSNDFFYYYKTSEELESCFPDRTVDDNPVVFIMQLKN